MSSVGKARHTLVAIRELPALAEEGDFAAVFERNAIGGAGPARLSERRYGELLAKFARIPPAPRGKRSTQGP